MAEIKTKKEIPRDHTWVWENSKKGNFGFLFVISGNDAVVSYVNGKPGNNNSWIISEVVSMSPLERSEKGVHGDYISRVLNST